MRQRQRERQQIKGFMSKTTAVHVGYKSMKSSFTSSAQQQRLQTGHISADRHNHLGPFHQMLHSSTKAPTVTPRLRRSAGLDPEGQYLL